MRNSKKTIGILGATGIVGSSAAKYLVENDCPLDILLGSRNIEKLKNVQEFLKEKNQDISIAVMKIDLQNDLDTTFFDKCDLIIDCAGPIEKLGLKALYFCQKNKIPYFSPVSDRLILEKIEQLRQEDESQLCLLGCGLSPGLLENLPFSYAKQFQKIDSIKEYIGGIGEFSISAIYDIISSIRNNQTYDSGIYYEILNGMKVLSYKKWKKVSFPEPLGNQLCIAFMPDSMEKVAASLSCENVVVYDGITFSNLPLQANIAESSSTVEELCGKIKIKHVDESQTVTCIQLEIHGLTKQGLSKKKIQVFSREGGESLTGKILGATVQLYLENKISCKGIRNFHEMIHADDMLARIGFEVTNME